MIQGVSEIAAMCVGLVGLVGAAAATGLPMWKVTAFIGENIIVMETRWEGLWMNCFRQSNIRMQCKVYDSLLYLPPELQAARGLMCCSVTLSGLGLLVGLPGMRTTSCFSGNTWVKTILLMIAGGMQFMACICVIIPVSWTAHTIISDFYNPLLIDAQRRELGEALYIGWVTGAILFASALLFVCRRMPSDKRSFNVYHPGNLLNYKMTQKPTPTEYHPISGFPSVASNGHQGSLQYNGSVMQPAAMPLENIPPVMTTNGPVFLPAVAYNPNLPETAPIFYEQGLAHQPSLRSSFHDSTGNPVNSLLISRNTSPYAAQMPGNYPVSHQSSFHVMPQTPVFLTYKASRINPEINWSRSGVYI